MNPEQVETIVFDMVYYLGFSRSEVMQMTIDLVKFYYRKLKEAENQKWEAVDVRVKAILSALGCPIQDEDELPKLPGL